MRHFITRLFYGTTLLSLVIFNLFASAKPVQGASTITVTTTADEAGGTTSTGCSLREAIISANENKAFGGCATGSAGLDYIRIPSSNRVYSLKLQDSGTANENAARTGDLDILESVQIVGDKMSTVQISGASARNRVFHVRAGNQVLFQNLTIFGGDYVPRGGGIWVEKGQVTLNRVHLDGNHAQSAGGGMVIDTKARALVEYSEISNNTAELAGGILNEGNLVLNNSLVWQNSASTSAGAISLTYLSDNEKTVITNTTITQNAAAGNKVAGVLVSSYATLELLNSTISRNIGYGLEIQEGGDGWVKNTIIARQERFTSIEPNCKLPVTHSFVSSGHNMVSDNTCGFMNSSDLVVPLENLGIDDVLANNGGFTSTYALLEGSPAVDAGDNNGCPKIDQRKFFRPAAGQEGGSRTCDIGAFELNGNPGFNTYIPSVRK